MRVNAAGVGLVDEDDFKSFAVVVEGDHDLGQALDGFGVLAGEHAFLEVPAVRGLAGERATPEWVAGFEKMIEYARSKGWMDELGRVRAHVERR